MKVIGQALLVTVSVPTKNDPPPIQITPVRHDTDTPHISKQHSFYMLTSSLTKSN